MEDSFAALDEKSGSKLPKNDLLTNGPSFNVLSSLKFLRGDLLLDVIKEYSELLLSSEELDTSFSSSEELDTSFSSSNFCSLFLEFVMFCKFSSLSLIS